MRTPQLLQLICLALIPQTAHAYIDPGIAGFLITSILGAIAAVGYTFRMYIAKVKKFFGVKSPAQDDKSDDDDDAQKQTPA